MQNCGGTCQWTLLTLSNLFFVDAEVSADSASPPQSPHGMGQAPQLIYARGHSRARVRAQGCPEHSASTAGVYAQSGVRAKKLCKKICHKQSRVRTFDKYNGTYNKNKKAT